MNGEAIYGTRPVYPFTYGKFRFTQKGDKVYAIFLLDEQESPVPETYWFDFSNAGGTPANLRTGKIKVLGSNKKATLSKEDDGRYRIDFPHSLEMPHAIVFELKTRK